MDETSFMGKQARDIVSGRIGIVLTPRRSASYE